MNQQHLPLVIKMFIWMQRHPLITRIITLLIIIGVILLGITLFIAFLPFLIGLIIIALIAGALLKYRLRKMAKEQYNIVIVQ